MPQSFPVSPEIHHGGLDFAWTACIAAAKKEFSCQSGLAGLRAACFAIGCVFFVHPLQTHPFPLIQTA
jgi:hypothetical protein